jgi:hypothetical protein
MIRRRSRIAALVLLTCPVLAAAGQPTPPGDDFPPTTAVPKVTIDLGETMTVGGPGSDNVLPDEAMNFYVVPHRTWREGDALGADAVARGKVKSNAKGQLLLTTVWMSDKSGTFDIVVDYDGNGRFSYSLDTVDALVVRAKK